MGWGWNLFRSPEFAGVWNPGAVMESIWGWNLGTDLGAGLVRWINSLGSKRTTGCWSGNRAGTPTLGLALLGTGVGVVEGSMGAGSTEDVLGNCTLDNCPAWFELMG